MRLKYRFDCKYPVNGILQCQLDIPQQLLIIQTISINKCITLAVFTTFAVVMSHYYKEKEVGLVLSKAMGSLGKRDTPKKTLRNSSM